MTHPQRQQLTTFYIDQELYGIDVMRVQEVTGHPTIVRVPLAPLFVLGMINLRGQLATALGLDVLFGRAKNSQQDKMSVVCKIEGSLVSLLVDSIGDVVEVEAKQFEPAPETVPHGIKRFLTGVYKMENNLLSVIDLEKLTKELSQNNEMTTDSMTLTIGTKT